MRIESSSSNFDMTIVGRKLQKHRKSHWGKWKENIVQRIQFSGKFSSVPCCHWMQILWLYSHNIVQQQARAHETNSKSEEIASLQAVFPLFMCLLFSLNYKEKIFSFRPAKKKLSLLLDSTTMMRIGELTSSSCSLLAGIAETIKHTHNTVGGEKRKTLNIFTKNVFFSFSAV